MEKSKEHIEKFNKLKKGRECTEEEIQTIKKKYQQFTNDDSNDFYETRDDYESIFKHFKDY